MPSYNLFLKYVIPISKSVAIDKIVDILVIMNKIYMNLKNTGSVYVLKHDFSFLFPESN